MAQPQLKYLFGGDKRWDPSQWTSSDDRVRGGKSQSYLTSRNGSQAEFSGNLDIKTLGGAGFASQRTVGGGEDDGSPTPVWNMSGYDSLVLDIAKSDGKKYTITLKDEIVPKRPDGRDQSTVSWEYDFVVSSDILVEKGSSTKLVIPLEEFEPTYRGRPKPDAEPLDLKNIRRISFMMRSFFGTQEGDFSITINSLSAEKKQESQDHSIDSRAAMKGAQHQDGRHQVGVKSNGALGWLVWLCRRSK